VRELRRGGAATPRAVERDNVARPATDHNK
jgi:hypothetical protein